MGRGLALGLAIALGVPAALTQSDQYRRASIAAILADPAAFHFRVVGLSGTVKTQVDRIVISNDDGMIRLLSDDEVREGDAEVRGVLVDVGRFSRGELDQFDIGRVIQSAHHTRWPKPGEEIVVVVSSVARQSRESAAIAKPPAQPLPLEIEFSAPVEGETDVRLDTRIRVQFSRDVERASLKNRIQLIYSQSDSAERGEAQPPSLDFTFDYDGATRGLEIKPRQRLERFRNVKLELLEGIVGTDGSVLKPWRLNFTTGGS